MVCPYKCKESSDLNFRAKLKVIHSAYLIINIVWYFQKKYDIDIYTIFWKWSDNCFTIYRQTICRGLVLFSWYCQNFLEIAVHQANKTINIVVQTPAKYIWNLANKTTLITWVWNYSHLCFHQIMKYFISEINLGNKLTPAELLGPSWSIVSLEIPGNFIFLSPTTTVDVYQTQMVPHEH